MLRPTVSVPLSLAALALLASFASAQEARPAASATDDKAYYYGPTTPTLAEPKSFSQQKARLRAEQRIARLESYRKFGITPNRPTAEALPFTSAYPLMWLRRSTTPVVTYQRPLMYYSYPYTLYR